jgi:hypothetical protein
MPLAVRNILLRRVPDRITGDGIGAQSPNVRHGNTGDTGDYPPEEVAQMAHSLAVKAITNP